MMFKSAPLATGVRRAALAGGMSLLAIPLTAHAEFKELTGAANPFSVITSGGPVRSLAMIDLDGDGDLEAAVFHDYANRGSDPAGYDDYYSSVWENTGTARKPEFTQLRDYAYGDNTAGEFLDANPFASAGFYYGAPITVADLVEDGEQGFLGGNYTQYSNWEPFHYFRVNTEVNDGRTEVTGADLFYRWDEDSPFYNWGYGASYGTNLAPTAYGNYVASNYYGYVGLAAGDLYGNGRADIVVADYNELRVFRNDGPGVSTYNNLPVFTQFSGSESPFYGGGTSLPSLTDEAYYGAPMALADLDKDGDLDLVMGNRGNAAIRVFQNTGTPTAPQFVERTSHELLAKYGVTDGFTVPVAADVNDDGRTDIIFMTAEDDEPQIRYFENKRQDDDEDEFLGSFGWLTLLLAGMPMLFRRRR